MSGKSSTQLYRAAVQESRERNVSGKGAKKMFPDVDLEDKVAKVIDVTEILPPIP